MQCKKCWGQRNWAAKKRSQNLTSRVYKKFMQPSMLSTSQQVWFLQIDKWKDKRLPMHEKASIWECFFAFTVCRENSYFRRKLAIMLIHETEFIIFLNYFIIKVYKKSVMIILNNLIGKDLPPKNKNTSHMGAFFCALRPSDTILFA